MRPVAFDGWIAVLLVSAPAATAWVCGDEAAKYLSPVVIFYCKGILSIGAVAIGGLKAFRSTVFATFKNGGTNGNGNGTNGHDTTPPTVVPSPKP